jgi:hypothetical protein
MEKRKLTPASDPEILRLLRAFFKIGDPRQRREIVTQVAWLASDQSSASETSLLRGNKLPQVAVSHSISPRFGLSEEGIQNRRSFCACLARQQDEDEAPKRRTSTCSFAQANSYELDAIHLLIKDQKLLQ